MSPTVKTVLAFAGGLALGGVAVLQLRENESSCCERVGYGVREEVVDRFGAPGGWLYDAFNLRAVAPALLDLFKVPKNA